MKIRILGLMCLFAVMSCVWSERLHAEQTPPVVVPAPLLVDLESSLPVDPNVKIGTLPNGMQYWIRKHSTPPGKIGVFLHVGSGSINEEENQRGLAHFLEHMAFNGSANFPAGTLIKYFESIGLRFGQHQNAFTSFDQTTYSLSLPDVKEETLDKGLQCMADYGFRLTISVEEVAKERGVILEEIRARKGPQQRLIEVILPILAPGSRFSERLPGGKEEVIKATDREPLVAYYKKWYRPDNATVIICGDMDLAVMEKLIAKNFSDWKNEGDKPKDVDPGIKAYTQVRANVVTDPELTETEVEVSTIFALTPRETVGDYRNQLIERIGTWIVNRRLATLVEKGNAPFQTAHTSVSPFLNMVKYTNASASGKPEQWVPMLTALLTELKRATLFGCLEQELTDAKNATKSAAEQSARTEATKDMNSFLQEMNDAISSKQKPMSQQQNLELLGRLLTGIKVAEVNEAFKKNFSDTARLLLITMPKKDGLPIPTSDDILAVAKKIDALTLESPIAKVRPSSLLEKEPVAGTVVSQTEDAETKILDVVLSNGVKVHLRSMDFKKNQVMLRLHLQGSELLEKPEMSGFSDVAGLAFSQPASATLDSTTIREMMTGKNVSVRGAAGEDSFVLFVSGAPNDFEDGLKLLHLMLTQPKIEESAFKVWREKTLQDIESRKTDTDTQAGEKLNTLIKNNDHRAIHLTKETVEKLTLEQGSNWLKSHLANAPIECSVVGDMDRDVALKLVLKYLGSLPPRPISNPGFLELRKIPKVKGPMEATVEVETITPTAVVLMGWRGANYVEVKDRRILQMGAQILGARLLKEIREERALTYSIGCFTKPAQVYPDTGFILAQFTADPAKAAEAAKLTREIMETFSKEGPTDAEVDTVHKQFKNTLESQIKEPGFWSGILSDMDYRSTKLSDVKEVLEKMQSYTKADILDVMKKYLIEENRIQVIALPNKK